MQQKHSIRLHFWGIGLVLVLAMASVSTLAQGSSPATGCFVIAPTITVHIRSGPGAGVYDIIGTLPVGGTLPVIGTNGAGDWYAVQFEGAAGAGSQDTTSAWIAAQVVETRGSCDDLPVLPDPGLPGEFTRLQAIPLLSDISDTARDIFADGQARGNDPHAFTTVGDCNTHSPYFLKGFDQDLYDLGPYEDLQPTIDFFAGWFEHESLTGQVGFNALTVLETLWVDPKVCKPKAGEGPLACEYRLTQASIAVIMFGPNDMLNLNETQFTESVRSVLELSIDRGVIPVLTTFTWHEDDMWQQALRYNVILVELAEEYDIPLINFWRAARDLPNLGLVTGYTHLTESGLGGGSIMIAFTGKEAVSGHALRNLLTLQMLDRLRREVIEPGLE